MVAVARNRHQAVDEPVEAVAAHEQTNALALAKPQYSDRKGKELIGLYLKQGVARIGLEDLVSAASSWLPAGNAARLSTARTLPLSPGISQMLSLYAAAV